MTQRDFHDDSMLNAYLDGELDQFARRRLLVKLERDNGMRERACDLQRTKDWVKSSFDGMVAPTRSLPDVKARLWGKSLQRVAASVAVAVVAFGAGWFGHSAQDSSFNEAVSLAAGSDARHVVLHIGETDESRFTKLLDRAEYILQHYNDTGTRVEVIANAGGLDLLRTGTSHQIERITAMMDQYDNVNFIACANGLKRLQELGVEPVLIEGVLSDESAGDHLIKRLHEGWSYIRI